MLLYCISIKLTGKLNKEGIMKKVGPQISLRSVTRHNSLKAKE